MKSMSNMNVARYSAPVCVLKDSFILVTGGVISGTLTKKYTTSTEIFDIVKN